MLALTTSLLAFQLPSAPIASRACAPSMCDAAATKTVPVTVGDTKVKFTNALGAALGVNPQFCQIPQNMQSFANELIMSETLAMASPRYTYTRVFALGFETLCDTFLSDGRSEKTAAATRSAMCVAFGLDQAQLEADASALRALSEGKSEEEVLAIDDLKELAAQKPTYSYIMGAGLTTLMKNSNMEKVDSEGIGKWVDTLGLGCKNALTRDYAYFESSVEKFGQMKDMFAQMDASAKRQAADRLAEKAKKAATEAEKAEADATA